MSRSLRPSVCSTAVGIQKAKLQKKIVKKPGSFDFLKARLFLASEVVFTVSSILRRRPSIVGNYHKRTRLERVAADNQWYLRGP